MISWGLIYISFPYFTGAVSPICLHRFFSFLVPSPHLRHQDGGRFTVAQGNAAKSPFDGKDGNFPYLWILRALKALGLENGVNH